MDWNINTVASLHSIMAAKLNLGRRLNLWSNGRTVQWGATHQGSNPGARTFS
jgi:hypothetical protein